MNPKQAQVIQNGINSAHDEARVAAKEIRELSHEFVQFRRAMARVEELAGEVKKIGDQLQYFKDQLRTKEDPICSICKRDLGKSH